MLYKSEQSTIKLIETITTAHNMLITLTLTLTLTLIIFLLSPVVFTNVKYIFKSWNNQQLKLSYKRPTFTL